MARKIIAQEFSAGNGTGNKSRNYLDGPKNNSPIIFGRRVIVLTPTVCPLSQGKGCSRVECNLEHSRATLELVQSIFSSLGLHYSRIILACWQYTRLVICQCGCHSRARDAIYGTSGWARVSSKQRVGTRHGSNASTSKLSHLRAPQHRLMGSREDTSQSSIDRLSYLMAAPSPHQQLGSDPEC